MRWRVQTSNKQMFYLPLLFLTTTTTIMAIIARMRSERKKQIHRFLRAERAELTAFPVWWRLQKYLETVQLFQGRHLPRFHIFFDYFCCCLDRVDSFVLLFHQHAHLKITKY
jgi:hypothetical protein